MPNDKFSRREFARRTAIASAAALLPAPTLGARTEVPAPRAQTPDQPKLAAASQAEADRRSQAVLSQYGSRLTEAQKAEIGKLSATTQQQLDHIREFSTANGDDPALYLKPLVERDRKSVLNPPVPKSSAPPAGLTPPKKS